MSKEKRRVPKLRFPGFTEDWEQCKLGSLASVEMNKRIFKEQTTTNGDIPFYKIGTFGSDADSFISRELFEEYKNKYPYPNIGDILISASGSIGRTVVYNGEDAYFQDSNIVWLNHNGKIDNSFLLQFYNQVKWAGLEGSTIKRLYNKNILETNIALPKIEEQRLIGKFFTLVDSTITLHQRKLEHLNLKKKALLQKLFPKNGECYPELRFPGFTDAWEQRKLSEITTCFDNLRVPVTTSDRVSGKTPYYGANGIQDYVSGNTHSGEFVLIAEDGANDLNDYPVQYVNGEIWVNNHAHVIAGFKEKLDNKFLSYALKTVKMTTFIVGSGRSKLNLKALLEIPISMPNYNEQCFVGKFIDKIDTNITLHQRKLDHLQLQKKALLQQMFV